MARAPRAVCEGRQRRRDPRMHALFVLFRDCPSFSSNVPKCRRQVLQTKLLSRKPVRLGIARVPPASSALSPVVAAVPGGLQNSDEGRHRFGGAAADLGRGRMQILGCHGGLQRPRETDFGRWLESAAWSLLPRRCPGVCFAAVCCLESASLESAFGTVFSSRRLSPPVPHAPRSQICDASKGSHVS